MISTNEMIPSHPAHTRSTTARFLRMRFAVILLVVLTHAGCRITDLDSARRAAKLASLGSKPIVSVKRNPGQKTIRPVHRWILGRPDPSERTQLFLRKNNLSKTYLNDPQAVVASLQKDCRCAPNMETVHAIAELSQLEADWLRQTSRSEQATKFYATAIVHAYQFLFDPKLNLQRNAYDPQFRQICDIYNQSLEQLLRLVCDANSFHHGDQHTIGDDDFGFELEIVFEGQWRREEFEKFEFVSDFEIDGIDNSYHTFGLGVPLIAVRKRQVLVNSPYEKYYPPSLALPLTAFCKIEEFTIRDENQSLNATLTLFDPLEKTVVQTDTRNAPLESDLTVPLAYYLNDPLLKTDVLSTVALLDAELAADYFGFYMLEPYDPTKIPVVMVHGLWSNPVTWMKMFNDLRANEWLRQHYQFWFYMYPTGQPFWFSAAQMRSDLAKLKRDVDPNGESETLNQMILVGHSMGGLVSRMQTIDSGNEFWNILSDEPITAVKGDENTVSRVKDLFYFEADPGIAKVVTIASPHQGSRYANNATRWLSHQLIRLPKLFTTSFDNFVSQNRDILRNTNHLTIPTSVDSLSPESPFIQKLAEASPGPGVQFHNIAGSVEDRSIIDKLKSSEIGDGVVSLESARCPNSVSELVVDAEHMEVHQHPESIIEVERILIENLVMKKKIESPNRSNVRHVNHEQVWPQPLLPNFK